MKPSRVVDSVQTFLENEINATESASFYVGVSGGVDSMVLMDVLGRLEDNLTSSPTILHYNYRLHDRAQASYRSVLEEASKRGFTVVVAETLLSEQDFEEQSNFEASARDLRYNFFRSAVRSGSENYVFLAHQRLDQVETILLNMGRGTGLSGLSGMKKIMTRNNLTVCRPLLDQPAQAIEDYAEQRDLRFVEDPTNKDTGYARNRLRHEILPSWREVQPDPDTAILRLGERARRENHFWEAYVEDAFRDWSWQNELQVDRSTFRDHHTAAQFRYVRGLVEQLVGTVQGWSETNLRDLRDLFADGRSGEKRSIPGPFRALNEFDRGCLFRTDTELQTPDDLTLSGTGDYELEELGELTVTDVDGRSSEDRPGDWYECTVPGPLDRYQLRSWNQGDYFLKRGSKRKLKELFDEYRVPYRARRYWPLLTDNGLVRYIPGLLETGEASEGEFRFLFRPGHPTFHQIKIFSDDCD